MMASIMSASSSGRDMDRSVDSLSCVSSAALKTGEASNRMFW